MDNGQMSAREASPLPCASPPIIDSARLSTGEQDFTSFDNPVLGVSVSCSLGQLTELKGHLQTLTPASSDRPMQAPFFTPISNKTYDSASVTNSTAFHTAMGTAVRSSQSVKADNANVLSRKLEGKALCFNDGVTTGCGNAVRSRPNSYGSGTAALGPPRPSNIKAPQPPAVLDMNTLSSEVISQVAADSHCPSAMAFPQAFARGLGSQADPMTSQRMAGTCDMPPPSVDTSIHVVNSLGQLGADSSSSLRTQQGGLSTVLDASAHLPWDAATIHTLLPAPYMINDLQEGSGETCGNVDAVVGSRSRGKLSSGPASSVHAQVQRPHALKREKNACVSAITPQSAQAGTTPMSAAAVRKASGSSIPASRQRHDTRETPALSTKPPSSAVKQSQPCTIKASTAAITPGRQSSQKPRRPSTVGNDAPREAVPRVTATAHMTPPPRRVSKASAASRPALCDANVAPVASVAPASSENQLPGDMGPGTPFFVKRVRPALGNSPPLTPFAALKCPPPIARGAAGSAAHTAGTPTGIASGTAALLQPGKPEVASAQQRLKRSARSKAASATAVVAKAAEVDGKAGTDLKVSAGNGRGGAPACDAVGGKRNPTGSVVNKAVLGGKGAAAGPAATKVGHASAANRAIVTNQTKPAAAGTTGMHGKDAAKQPVGKQAAEATGKSHVNKEALLDGEVAGSQVVLGRVSSAGGASTSSAAAGRYGKSQQCDQESSAAPDSGRAACHSPDKLPPSKRSATPITSPSKRPRQERNPSAPPTVPPMQTSAGARRLSGGRACLDRHLVRPASSPGARGAVSGQGVRSLSANARRPRDSVPVTVVDRLSSTVPETFTVGGSGGSGRKLTMPLTPWTAPCPPTSAEVPQDAAQPPTQPLPKLILEGIVPCKSPLGTPHLRNNGTSVAADLVPLWQQPVSAARSPALLGGAASVRRPSPPSLTGCPPPGVDMEVGMPSPIAAAVVAVQVITAAGPADNGLVAQSNTRGLESALAGRGDSTQPRAPPVHAVGHDAAQGSAVVKTKVRSEHSLGRNMGPGGGSAVGDAVRPLTARQSTVASGVGAGAAVTVKGTAAQRSSSARSGSVFKPAPGGMQVSGAIAPKVLLVAAPPPQPLLASTKTAATAPKAKQPVQHEARIAQQHTRSTSTAGRQQVPVRGARIDPQQDRAERRRQYEALLCRTGAVSHVQEPAVAVENTAMTAASGDGAMAATGKAPGAKPQGARATVHVSLPQPERLGVIRKAPMPQPGQVRRSGSATAGGARSPAGATHGEPGPQPQHAKPAPNAKNAAVPKPAGRASRAAAGVVGTKSTDERLGPCRSGADDGPRLTTTDTAAQLNEPDTAAAASTATPREQLTAGGSQNSLSATDVGAQACRAEASRARQDEQATPSEQDATPKRLKDLSWLVDASPYTSLAATSGELTANNVFTENGSGGGFGFGGGPEDGPASDASPVSSPGFPAFGAPSNDPQLQPTPSPCVARHPHEEAGPFDACQGDAVVVVTKQPMFAARPPLGLPPSRLLAGGLGAVTGSGLGAGPGVPPNSTFSLKSLAHLTPGPGMLRLIGQQGPAAASNAKAPIGAPGQLPQAKLRFSWDPAAHGTTPMALGSYACPSPGIADSFLGFGPGTSHQEETPVSMPRPAGFTTAALHREEGACKLEGMGAMVDGENVMDQDMAAEVPIPMQCTSPNTPAPDAFSGLALGGEPAGGKGVMVFGGGGGGMGRAGRVVQDSFDALRISSMSSWPMLQNRESE